jgi:DNA-binding LytR/AlgR family response regulator
MRCLVWFNPLGAAALLRDELCSVVLRRRVGSGPETISVRWRSQYALIAALVHVRTLSNLEPARRKGAIAAQDTKQPEAPGVVNENHEEPVAVPAIRAVHSTAELDSEAKAGTMPDAGVSRYFIKIGEELRPLDVDMVVSINGADDYAEVSTTSGKHLVRVTLASFAKSLDPSKYIR